MESLTERLRLKGFRAVPSEVMAHAQRGTALFSFSSTYSVGPRTVLSVFASPECSNEDFGVCYHSSDTGWRYVPRSLYVFKCDWESAQVLFMLQLFLLEISRTRFPDVRLQEMEAPNAQE